MIESFYIMSTDNRYYEWEVCR